jgi:adenine-specific DNA-methyltransferase
MRKGIISQVSMECDYEEGECSVCHKRVKSKADYCPHLRKSKGGESGGQPVYEILHGVTFTGLGLLDRKGADENARILQVAHEQIRNEASENSRGDTEEVGRQSAFAAPRSEFKEGGPGMDEKKHPDENPSDAAKGKPFPGGGGDKPVTDDPQKRVTELEQENRQLKAQVAQLQKRVQELEAEQKSAANRSRAGKLIARLEKQGVNFGDDEERDSELKRLAELSDEAFSATEAAYNRLTKQNRTAEEKPAEKKEAARASDEEPMRSDAGVRPRDVDDRKASLEDRLREGFMAAYESRVGGRALAATRE